MVCVCGFDARMRIICLKLTASPIPATTPVTQPYGSHLDPTDGGIRWQVFASLAFGARGVLVRRQYAVSLCKGTHSHAPRLATKSQWFCYWYPTYDTEFPQGGSIITPRGVLTFLLVAAYAINAKRVTRSEVAPGCNI